MTTARIISGPLQDERRDDGRRVLLRSLAISLGVYMPELDRVPGVELVMWRDTIVTVPAGFDTDYSSIPRLALVIMGDWTRHDLAGVAHDWLYRTQAQRAAADRVWWIVARSGERHVDPVQGFLGWLGLRAGGWVAYRARGRERSS